MLSTWEHLFRRIVILFVAMLGMGGVSMMGGYLPRPLNNNYINTQPQTQSTEMIIPNELIGCIIGRGGAKINEIRYVERHESESTFTSFRLLQMC